MLLCFCSDKSPIKYFSDYSNLLNIIAVLVTILIIPFRFANLEFQWVFALITTFLPSYKPELQQYTVTIVHKCVDRFTYNQFNP